MDFYSPRKHESLLSKQAGNSKGIDNDGNGLFRAIAKGLTGNQIH